MEKNVTEMFLAAKNALRFSYAPYSHYSVGASILTDSNKRFVGTNIENASYSLTLCAEASAIAQMVGEGERKIKAILVTADSPIICTPCGACRQRIAEFAAKDTLVHLCDNEKCVQTLRIDELLPYSFNSQSFNNRKSV
jgi:cytidine deaminase